MKAVQFFRHGRASQVATLVDVAEPPGPGTGEVLAEVMAAPINPSDLLHFEGRYGVSASLPSFAGGGVLARVIALGPQVDQLTEGDWVLVLNTRRAGWCERFVWPADQAVRVPRGSPLDLSLLVVNPPTALLILETFGDLRPGDWVIQNAANSSVGLSLVQIARAKGLRTVNVVRRPALVPHLTRMGADVTLADAPDLREQVGEHVRGEPVKVAVDAIAGAATRTLAGCLADGGVVVNYGLLSGRPCEVDASDLVFRDISLRGFWYSRWAAHAGRDEFEKLFQRLVEMLEAGRLRVPIEAAYPIDELNSALAHAEQEGRLGKVVLTWTADVPRRPRGAQ